jgi:hypothetical protein
MLTGRKGSALATISSSLNFLHEDTKAINVKNNKIDFFITYF